MALGPAGSADHDSDWLTVRRRSQLVMIIGMIIGPGDSDTVTVMAVALPVRSAGGQAA